MNKEGNVVVVPEGYTLEDLLSLDDEIMCGEEPRFTDEIEVKYG